MAKVRQWGGGSGEAHEGMCEVHLKQGAQRWVWVLGLTWYLALWL